MAKTGMFFHAVMADWLARMSGPLTVPFAILAFVFPSTASRVLFAVLAVIAAMVTSYRVWAKEYDRAEAEKAKNETAPHMDIRWHNVIPHGALGSGVTDLFFYLELVLAEPSQLSIESFSLDIFDQGQSTAITDIDDLADWEWVRKEAGLPVRVHCEPITKNLTRRGDPVRGWIHFPIPNLSESVVQRLGLTINVNCKTGTCYTQLEAAYTRSDPDVKGVMRKVVHPGINHAC